MAWYYSTCKVSTLLLSDPIRLLTTTLLPTFCLPSNDSAVRYLPPFCVTGNASRAACINFAQEVAKVLPTQDAGSRFARLFDVGKKSKMHDFFILAGPLGAYMLELCEDLGTEQRTAMTLVLQACGDLWEKVIFK